MSEHKALVILIIGGFIAISIPSLVEMVSRNISKSNAIEACFKAGRNDCAALFDKEFK
jgi:hypothetical protein